MNKSPPLDFSRCCKSVFTLTFAVEILGIDEWEDCEQEWSDHGPYIQGMKIQYTLVSDQTYDLDILIWPHIAKVQYQQTMNSLTSTYNEVTKIFDLYLLQCQNIQEIYCGGANYVWVRTWKFLERRWITWSIRHAFPVRVIDFQQNIATVSPSMGTGALGPVAKNDKASYVCLPPLHFGERRYFAPVLESEPSMRDFIKDLIWGYVEEYIPASLLDGIFDMPHAVSDLRHQDAVLYHVQETVLEAVSPKHDVVPEALEPEQASKGKGIKKNPAPASAKTPTKAKFEINLSGDSILAGIGRIIPFQKIGDKPTDLGEIIVLISSCNLPAADDYPVVFLNVDRLCDAPMSNFKDLGLTELYTRWQIGEEVHDSKPVHISSDKDISFEDHHAIPLPYSLVPQVMCGFTEEYEVQLRGRRIIHEIKESFLFGYKKNDRDFDVTIPKASNTDTDFLIAITKIRTMKLAKSLNGFVKGEFPLFPPRTSVRRLDREGVCTNDINGVRIPVEPYLVVKPDVVLMAQMTLEVSIGLVGCKPNYQKFTRFSRMFCLIKDSTALMTTLRYITTLNEKIQENDDLLTGFALDTGDVAFLYVEGPQDGYILRVWDMTEDFYPILKPVFSCSVRYSTRIYPELLAAEMPFSVLKMFVPLGVLLVCPPVYARPALPLPTRAAVLKIGRLVASKLEYTPSRSEMPTGAELKSLRLELCVAPRPVPVVISEEQPDEPRDRINSKDDDQPGGVAKLKVSMAKMA